MANSGRARTSALMAFAGLALMGLSACQTSDTDNAAPSAQLSESRTAGKALAESLCAACHAVARSDASPHPEAPPLRHLGRKYPVRHLEEALAEGIFVGHPDMPAFQLQPDDIDALLDYLESIQT
ncbi:MAG: c-type cytochrome [Hyphomonas sp.]